MKARKVCLEPSHGDAMQCQRYRDSRSSAVGDYVQKAFANKSSSVVLELTQFLDVRKPSRSQQLAFDGYKDRITLRFIDNQRQLKPR